MCQILPSRVTSVLGARAEVELGDGQRATVDCTLRPDVREGDYVLVDRGLVVERLTAEEAQTIIEMYREIGELLDAEDALA